MFNNLCDLGCNNIKVHNELAYIVLGRVKVLIDINLSVFKYIYTNTQL